MVLRLNSTLALISVLLVWVPWVPLVSVGGLFLWVAVLGQVFIAPGLALGLAPGLALGLVVTLQLVLLSLRVLM